MAGKKTIINGIKFDSKLEAEHYAYFLKNESIKIKKVQPIYKINEPFEYSDPFSKKGTRKMAKTIYTPDFLIEVDGIDKPVVIEVKGLPTPVYQLRKKLFIQKYVQGGDLYFLELKSLKQTKQIFEKEQ